jgi:hypothetical protein
MQQAAKVNCKVNRKDSEEVLLYRACVEAYKQGNNSLRIVPAVLLKTMHMLLGANWRGDSTHQAKSAMGLPQHAWETTSPMDVSNAASGDQTPRSEVRRFRDMSSQASTSGTRLSSTGYFSGSYNNVNDTVAQTSGSSWSSNYLAFQQTSTGTAQGMADGRLVGRHTGTAGALFVGNGPHLASRTGQASSSSFQSATTTG